MVVTVLFLNICCELIDFLGCILSRYFQEFTIDNLFSILSILVNAGIAIYIVQSVQKRLSDHRAMKDFLNNEIKAIWEDYKTFLKDILNGKGKFHEVNSWFKIMGLRIRRQKEIIDEEFNIDIKEFYDSHLRLRQVITSTEEFNESTKKPIKFSPQHKEEIIQLQSDLNKAMFKAILKISRK